MDFSKVSKVGIGKKALATLDFRCIRKYSWKLFLATPILQAYAKMTQTEKESVIFSCSLCYAV